MENLLLTLQRPPNNEVPPIDETNGGDDESCTFTKKDVDNILAKAKEDDTLKEHEIKPPYPLWMDSVPFLAKSKQPTLQTYTRKLSARQYVIHFKILIEAITDQDAVKIRLFASSLKGSWFDDEEDQEAVQENVVHLAPANAPLEPNHVEPQGVDGEEDLAPMQPPAIEQDQDRINPLCHNQNPEPEVLENLQASPPVTPENEESCWVDDPLTSEDEPESQQFILGATPTE
ncbi:hypothetical protein AAC387_Pa10g0251 [Persea americana]